jgi:hypothetical protein
MKKWVKYLGHVNDVEKFCYVLIHQEFVLNAGEHIQDKSFQTIQIFLTL